MPNIHFDFTLSAADAENLFGCITNRIAFCHEKVMECIVSGDEQAKNAYKAEAEYLQQLKKKLSNTAVS
jgi:hypothetical protein